MVKSIHVEAPFAVFGGPYSNREATVAVLDHISRAGIPPERTFCTGDVIAYCGDPTGTLDLVRCAGLHVVQGNCEEQLGADASDCGCGYAPGSACEQLSHDWFSYASSAVTPEMRDWMAALPARLDIVVNGVRLAILHGGATVNNRFIFASTDTETKARELALAETDGIIGGHCGLPFTGTVKGRLWHNPGVIGLPANDGTPRGWYSLVKPRGSGLEIEHCAFTYDHSAAADRIRTAGLPDAYATALEQGLWPSCDVLPPQERAARGKPIHPRRHFWDGPYAAAITT